MSALKVGVIGLGVGEKHAEAFENHPDCALVSICDTDPAKMVEVAGRHPGPQATHDPNSILDDPEIDIVAVASWDDAHFDQITRALDNGKHVFAEKPLVLFEDEARAVRAKLDARPDLRLCTNVILRRSPRFIDLKARIEAGRLGRVFHIEGDYNYGRLHKITEGWRRDIPFYSVVYGGGVHLIDLMMWLLDSRVVEVSAFGNAIASQGSGFSNFDLVSALLRFENGVVGRMTANFGCVYPHFHPLAIYGTEGTFVNGRGDAALYRSRDPEAVPEPVTTAYPGVHKGDLVDSFVAAIRTGAPAEVTEDDVFETLSVCFAIEKAAHEGGTVAVDYI